MYLETWRTRDLTADQIRAVRELLYSLPRCSWALARKIPPLSLVKWRGQNMKDGRMYSCHCMVVDYGEVPETGAQYVVAVPLTDDGTPEVDRKGGVQSAVLSPENLSLVSTCGPISEKWMNQHFCDG